jgi:hypothetical protein
MGLQIFRDTIARHPQVKDRLRNLLLENVQKERLGQLIDRSLMKSTLGMLVDLGIEGTAVYEVRRGPAQFGTGGRGARGPRASTDRVICLWVSWRGDRRISRPPSWRPRGSSIARNLKITSPRTHARTT